jgi:OPA family glycerol-3-phosphate transporter-like MFS transporter
MQLNLSFLRPAPHIPRVSREQAQRLYPKMRWQIMESTFIGYATFYFVRNNLPVVSREMGIALHYSKEQMGNILAATAISYGVGKLFMGAWSDRSNARYFMPLGLLVTAFCNFAFGAASSYSIHLALWALNGLAQSMGWAPCGRSIGHWYSVSERGTKFAFWNVAQNVGGGLTGLLVAYCTFLFGWRSAFYVPGVLAIVCALYLLIRLRDTPQSVGLPPIEEWRNDYPASGRKDTEKGSIALFVGEADGGRRRSEEKSQGAGLFHLAWKSRKSFGISTSPTAPATTTASQDFDFPARGTADLQPCRLVCCCKDRD